MLGLRAAPRHSWLGVWLCVRSCACCTCTPPLLAGLCGVRVCALARVSAAPRHSWVASWGVCVFVCALRMFPCQSWLGCAVLGGALGPWLRLRPATPGGGVGVCVCTLSLYPAPPGWAVRRGCVCLGSGLGCAPPLLAGVLGCVCVLLGALLVLRHSSLACAAWVCVLGFGFGLRPATPGLGVRVCVCLYARSACTPPLLAGVCGVGVCAWAWDLAAPRHYWLGCWGVCLLVCVLRFYRATPGWGVQRGCVWPTLVRRASSGRVALGALVRFPYAVVPFPIPAARAPGFTGRLRGARGGRPRTGLLVPAAGPRRGRGSRLAPFWSPRWGCPWRVPLASVLGCVRCGGLRVWTRSLTHSVFRNARLLTGGLGRCTGAVSCGRRHHPFLVGGRHARVSCVCACARSPGRDGRAGLPGVFWCASPFPVDGLGALFVCSAPSGLGLSCLWLLLGRFSSCAPVVSSVPCFPAQGCLGAWRLLVLPPAPPPCLLFFAAPMSVVFRGFFCFCASFTPPPVFFCLRCSCFRFVSSLFFSYSAADLFFSYFPPWCAGCAVLWLFCVSTAVGCAGVYCCGRCAPAGARVRLCCVVG